MAQKARFGRQVVQAVVLLPHGQCGLAHVQVHDLRGPALQGHHRERAGVGKQVENIFVQCMVFQPLASDGHVEKQAVVLPAHQMNDVTCALLGHHMRLGNAARHQARFGFTRNPALEHPIERHARGQGLPAGFQSPVALGQFCIVHRFEAGQDPDGCEPVQRPLFTAAIQAASSMKNTPDVVAQSDLRDRVQKGLHGDFQYPAAEPLLRLANNPVRPLPWRLKR